MNMFEAAGHLQSLTHEFGQDRFAGVFLFPQNKDSGGSIEMDTITLGGKDYPIRPLKLGDARRWRERVVPVMLEVTGTMDASLSDPSALRQALLNAPERLAEIVFSYAPELPREEIMESATEEELGAAFNQVMVAAFRPLMSMAGTVKTIARLLSSPVDGLLKPPAVN